MKNTKRITQDQLDNIHIQLDEVIEEAIKEAIVNNKSHDIYFNNETLEIFSLLIIGEEKLIGENIHMITSIEYDMFFDFSASFEGEDNNWKEDEDLLEWQTQILREDIINVYELYEDIERMLNINEEEVN